MSRHRYRYHAPSIMVLGLIAALMIGTVLAGIWWVSQT